VAIVPDSVAKLGELGFHVRVEAGAGKEAGFFDAAYEAVGAEILPDAASLYAASDMVVKVRGPSLDEIAMLKSGTTLVSLLFPTQNTDLVDALAERKATVLALDKIPRITRAQKMDVLSSMANIAGYRAIIEAAEALPGFFGAQVTAAGSTPPAKVLIIGAGVAGLAAIGAARSLGAEVRAFDARPVTKEQVESLGATFLEVHVEESGDGGGGYAKVMSKEFIEAEMALFRAQAAEVSVIVTTALVPGKKAPLLVPRDVVEAMKPGSVVVDLAAEQGGNCELTRADEVVDHGGVKILGYTDLTSRMASTSSRFFSGNIVHLLEDMVNDDGFFVDREDEAVRGALQVHDGEKLEPPPPPAPRPPPKKAEPRHAPVKKEAPKKNGTLGTVLGLLLALAFVAIGQVAPSEFLQHFTVFILACFVGWQVVWSVSAALHTPLMSVTNAISGIIVVGGLLGAGVGPGEHGYGLAPMLGAAAILVASINIFGGFYVTQRMLAMFQRKS